MDFRIRLYVRAISQGDNKYEAGLSSKWSKKLTYPRSPNGPQTLLNLQAGCDKTQHHR